jgi:hypothetical protein
MLTAEERALATDIADRLIELYVERDEARRAKDWDRVRDRQAKIDETAAERQELLHRAEVLAEALTLA